nr:phosphotransferase [Kineosporia mesophila]
MPSESRPADYRPGSADLGVVATTIAELGTHSAVTASLRAETRWPGCPAGPALLHTDLHTDNVMISARGAHVIDWAWLTAGPAWVDPFIWAVYLVRHGHTPASADAWASRIPAWQNRPAAAVTAFADTFQAIWDEIAIMPGPKDWPQEIAQYSRAWREYLLRQS